MRYITLLILTLCFAPVTQAQIYEFGVFAGGSNFIGDVGATDYISPQKLAIGGLVKWNRSPRHAYRLSLTFSELIGQDSKSSDRRRVERDYSFESKIMEISAGMEFTFWDFNLHGNGMKSTPYLYTGISVAHHDNFYFDTSGNRISENTSSWAFGIPIVAGYKFTLTNHLILAGEIGARYTFSDELDGSVADSKDRSSYNFGNINSNDWYVFTGLTLTYTFGQKPCYCTY